MSVRDVVQAAAGVGGGAGDLAAAIDFDGTNDYLSRSSDLTGNADGNTFTFSCWVYKAVDGATLRLFSNGDSSGTNSGLLVYAGSSDLVFVARNSSGTTILDAHAYTNIIPANTWTNILISVDLSSTSNRKIYLNDTDVTSSFTWGIYTNGNINFTTTTQSVGKANNISSQLWKGRLSNLFLDYTYRDLSVTNNRRLFITEDGKPADGQAGLNPIMYMPLDDPEDIGYNAGTGGDFTVNGVMARSGRGPNQDNCSASKFDGTNDYLSRSSISGLTDGKQFTFSCVVNGGSNHGDIFSIGTGSYPSKFSVDISSDYVLRFSANNASDTSILSWYANLSQKLRGATNLITISVDTTNQSGSKVFINNVDSGGSFATFTNDSIDFTASEYFIGADYSALKADSVIGELYFDTSYTDLATSNPFWDSDLNKPVSVRKVIEDTGVTPLIALPLRANDAGNNLGTGGDFTVNSGPYVGARGASEFLARSAQMLGTNTGNYLNNNSISGLSAGKTFTLMVAVKSLGSSDKQELFHLYNSSNQDVIKFTYDLSSNGFYVNAYDSARNLLLSSSTLSLSPNVFNIFLISINLASRVDVYVNGTAGGNLTIESNANIDFPSIAKCYINAENTGSDNRASQIASLYFSTSYIDFSQEANRLKFVDGLGYPVDLQPAIDAGDISTPLIHMKFDDTSALGTNSGTGGDFTINGTVTSGADVSV